MKIFYSSLARISDLQHVDSTLQTLPRHRWGTGDYVAGRVRPPMTPLAQVEMTSGRLAEVFPGDLVVGALGTRRATLEAVGDWRLIEEDEPRMQALTSAALFGRCTSKSSMLPSLLQVDYAGHVIVDGDKATMRDYVETLDPQPLTIPVVLLVGTSMAAGKTTTAKLAVRELKELGRKVVGAKIAGAGRYRDILALRDAGADWIYDFVDVGLPSTVCSRDEYASVLPQLLARIEATGADVAVIEIGASPQEPYNGDAAIAALADKVALTILCASDPYAVVGVMQAFGTRPDLASGVATSTEAGIELVEKLTGVRAINVLEPDSRPVLRDLLAAV